MTFVACIFNYPIPLRKPVEMTKTSVKNSLHFVKNVALTLISAGFEPIGKRV